MSGVISVEQHPIGAALSPDGSQLYTMLNSGETPDAQGYVAILDTHTQAVVDTIPIGAGFVYGVAFTPEVAVAPNGKQVYVSDRGNNTVHVIDTTNNTVIKTIAIGDWADWHSSHAFL